MIIKKVTVKRLRALRQEKTVEFSPGLNIIKGSDNEVGKSSLRIAITKALFQDPTTSQKEIQALTSWGTDEPWEVTLEFDADGNSYRITKSLRDKTGELEATGPQPFVARNKNTIAEKIQELTGCSSETFFESTACIGQDEAIRIVPGGVTNTERQSALGTISKRLQAKLSGTEGVDILSIVSRLHDKTHRKDAGGPYRHLQDITERIVHLRSQKSEQEKRANDILDKRRRLQWLREELAKLEQELPAQREVLLKNHRILELQKEIAREKAQYENLNRAKEFRSRLDGLEEELQAYSNFVAAETKMEQLSTARNAVDSLNQQQADRQSDLETLQRQKPALWVLLAGLLVLVGGLAGGLTGEVAGWLVSPYILAAAAIGFLAAATWLLNQRAWKKHIELATNRVSEVAAQLQENEGKVTSLLSDFGCRDYDEYQRLRAEYNSKTQAQRDTTSKLDTLLDGKDWPQFVQANAELDIKMSTGLKELEQLAPFKLEPIGLQKLEGEAGRLEKQAAEFGREKGSLEQFLEYTDADTDQLTEIEEELKGLEQEKEFWERKKKVYDRTREILEDAYKQTLSRAADLLEKEISRYMSAITDGKYQQVKISESDLYIRTFSPQKNDWVDVLQLSRATQDQFYICARLALVKLITEGKRPPLLLDDPFVNFHAKRLRKIIPLLQEMAKESQILLFTCDDAYDYLGHVIALD